NAGLEPRQHQLLLAVKGMPAGRPATVGAIAEQLVLRHHSTVELLDRLERRGLVRRVTMEEDRRQIRVEILPAGEDLLNDLTVAHKQELRRLAPILVTALQKVVG